MNAWTFNKGLHVCGYIVQFDFPSVIRSSKEDANRPSVNFVAKKQVDNCTLPITSNAASSGSTAAYPDATRG